jgi:hypothetical protein
MDLKVKSATKVRSANSSSCLPRIRVPRGLGVRYFVSNDGPADDAVGWGHGEQSESFGVRAELDPWRKPDNDTDLTEYNRHLRVAIAPIVSPRNESSRYPSIPSGANRPCSRSTIAAVLHLK